MSTPAAPAAGTPWIRFLHAGQRGGDEPGPGGAATAVPPRAAAFLDRDGTVIEDTGYVGSAGEVALVAGAAEGLAELRALGFLLVVVSNQSGIARGRIGEDAAREVHRRTEELLARHGVVLDAAYYCPHGPEEGCPCRKPRPGMLIAASLDLGLDMASSVAIGDSARDLDAGRAAGCGRTVLLASGGWRAVVEQVRSRVRRPE